MKQPLAIQNISRSQVDRSRLCIYDQAVFQQPTAALVHQDAHLLLIRSGRGRIRIQGQSYALSPGCLVAILPWQISEITQVAEDIRYSLLAYHLDTALQAVKLFRGEDGAPILLEQRMEERPVVDLSGCGLEEAQRILDALQQELGQESLLPPESGPYSGAYTLSLLVQLMVVYLRALAPQSSPAKPERVDYREALRYMYLHCNEKLTLSQLGEIFYCSDSTLSGHITAMTGLSFFDLLNEMRIGKAANFLLYTDLTLKEMADFLGYVDESHISKVFAARVGTKISEYRSTYQKVQNICCIQENQQAYEIVQYVYRNYKSDLSAKEVAAGFGISVAQLHRSLLALVERNFEELLGLIRVNKACELLLHTEKTVLDIAMEVGYHTSKTLTRNFLKYRLSTPSAYRAAARKPVKA